MASALSILIPVHVRSPAQSSPAVRRLESYNDRVSVRAGKSPEVVRKRLEDASLRAFQHVKAIVSKVRVHNIETANRVYVHRVQEEKTRETFRQQVLDNLVKGFRFKGLGFSS